MAEFLKGQFDFILFFYGLAFFFMALVCFTIGRDKLRKLPWLLLGSFGLLYGFAEWTGMIAYMQSQTPRFLSLLNLSLLAASYLCLFEFGRIGMLRLNGTKISRWMLAPIFLLLPLGYKLGMSGWIITVRYFLGFPSAYLASRVIYGFSKKEGEDKRPLAILGLLMALYAVLTGFIVPRAQFIPANLLNVESFFDTFRIPVQLANGILGLCATLAIWFYSSHLSEMKFRPKRYSIRFMPTKWTIVLTLIIFISAGWVFTNYLDYYAGIQTIKRTKANEDSQLNRLTKELTLLGRMSSSLSRSWAIRVALFSQQPQNIGKAHEALKKFRERLGASTCFLLDGKGKLIASSFEIITDAERNKSYASKTYFKDALSGKNGYNLELGTAYDERIYYISSPVKDTSGKISGAVVIVKNIHSKPLFQYRLFSITITFLVCIIAIIFFIALRRREGIIRLIEKMHQELQEVDNMKTDFVSVVSHELRTPLTSIRNAASILMKGGPSKRTVEENEKELLEIIINNVDRQTRMVSDLLDVSKIEAGVMPVDTRPTNIVSLVKEVMAVLKPQAEDKKIHLDLSCQTKELIVSVDPEHARRIVNNLLVNAIKFTPDNGRITIGIDDWGNEARIKVADTGIGISGEDKEKLFDKFYRSSDTAVQQKGGWGLGLMITKGLVEAQKGKIWVESRLGEGSVFSFTLPVPKQGKP